MARKSTKSNLTPMMRQYHAVRRELPDNAILLFRLGDFYEMFHQDAEVGARVLGITLTQRQNYPMAGIPYHAADGYISKLLAAGLKVAICDQMEAPRPGQIVKRQLTRILTPGTTLEEHQLDARSNQYLLALDFTASDLAAAWLDLSTGDFALATAPAGDLLPLFSAIDPREIVLPEESSRRWREDPDLASWLEQFDAFAAGRPVSELPDFYFDRADGCQAVQDTLGVLNLDGFGIDPREPGLGPAGALIHYASENLCAQPENLRRIRRHRTTESLLLDPATLRNLEIFRTVSGKRPGSLIAAIDASVTSGGSRLLERYLATPSLDTVELRRRKSCVRGFLEDPGATGELQEALRTVRDVERILGRLENRIRNPRELGGIRDSLLQYPLIKELLGQFEEMEILQLDQRIDDFAELREVLQSTLADDLPGQLQEGGYIRDGCDESLDHLRGLTRDNRSWIADLEKSEQARTGIRNLRIRFNNAFGYFIEVTKSNLQLVPDDYTRKQTMTNAERFVTPELKEKEKEILHADEQAIAREEELFRDLVAHVLARADTLRETAAAIAEADLFSAWARVAREWDYCEPEFVEEPILEIDQGRHPVVEQMLRDEQHGIAGNQTFVPNDTLLEADGTQIALITGPNMAGKSTYIRQVALITLMAQIGCWVPARRFRLGPVDRIFSRVGASDELARGNSTFMVEMNETANILNNATDRSLVILDEIGRGTSTYDGLSIAWAVVEHLHGEGEAGPRTLFATHYHELTQLSRRLSRLRNFRVAVKEWNDQIIFVRQVVEGGADRSYGIHVARLAGLPDTVISRARTILERLESDDSSHNLLRRQLRRNRQAEESGEEIDQMELF